MTWITGVCCIVKEPDTTAAHGDTHGEMMTSEEQGKQKAEDVSAVSKHASEFTHHMCGSNAVGHLMVGE